MVQTALRTLSLAVARGQGGQCPYCAGRAGRAGRPIPCPGADPFSRQTVRLAIEIPQLLLDTVIGIPCCAGCAGHSCRGAEADPHGLVDDGDSPVALR